MIRSGVRSLAFRWARFSAAPQRRLCFMPLPPRTALVSPVPLLQSAQTLGRVPAVGCAVLDELSLSGCEVFAYITNSLRRVYGRARR